MQVCCYIGTEQQARIYRSVVVTADTVGFDILIAWFIPWCTAY